jgi:uncharacterized protein (DUF736 family)
MQYDNTNRGAIFKNTKKATENHPDMTGSIDVNGVEYWVSAWSKTSQAGAKFLSMSVKPKDEKPAQYTPPKTNDVEFDDDLPF